jgi:hypothetical protein
VFIGDAHDNLIGGTTAGAGNLISGNEYNGIVIVSWSPNAAYGNVVQGNFIGTDVTGTAPLANAWNSGYPAGVWVDAGPSNTIGGTAPGASNLIAYNGGAGVRVDDNPGTAILSNRIYANTGLGIDLEGDGVTPNDPGDADTGANNLQNFPLLTSAVNANGGPVVRGTLNSTPSTSFLLQFFANTTADPSGYGEGQRFLGSATVTTDAAGDVRDAAGNLGFTVTLAGTVPGGQFVSATATRLDAAGVPRDTSEFSPVVAVPGSIAGQKFLDLNANGVRDPGEPGLANWVIYLDANGNGQLDPGERYTKTDAAGNYVFVNPPPGATTVREVLPAGWIQSTPGPSAGFAHKLIVTAGQVVTGRDFGNYQLGSIAGQKFHDLNGNGLKDPGEPGLPGWTIYLDGNNNGQLDPGEVSAVTDAFGNYRFDQLRPGSYVVREVMQPGWRQSAPAAGSYAAVLTSGQAVTGRDFGNYQPVAVAGTVFHDYDANRVRAANEPGLKAWRVYLDANNNGQYDAGEDYRWTDAAGRYSFTGLRPGTDVVREEVQAGWRQTAPAAGAYVLTLTSGQAAIGDFGDTPRDPLLIVGLSPTAVSEAAGPGAATGTVIRSGAPTTASLAVSLSSSDTTEAQVPATVTIPAGQSSATFPINAIDDTVADGPQSVLISAAAAGYIDGRAALQVTDNDPAPAAAAPARNTGATPAGLGSPILIPIAGPVTADALAIPLPGRPAPGRSPAARDGTGPAGVPDAVLVLGDPDRAVGQPSAGRRAQAAGGAPDTWVVDLDPL